VIEIKRLEARIAALERILDQLELSDQVRRPVLAAAEDAAARRAMQIMTDLLLIATTVLLTAIVIGSLQHINPKP
jgi:hypothetical protein